MKPSKLTVRIDYNPEGFPCDNVDDLVLGRLSKVLSEAGFCVQLTKNRHRNEAPGDANVVVIPEAAETYAGQILQFLISTHRIGNFAVSEGLKRLALQGFREDGTFGPARRKSFVGCDLTAPSLVLSSLFNNPETPPKFFRNNVVFTRPLLPELMFS